MEQEVIHIERLSYGPAAIGHLSSGKTVFVDGAVPGDRVRIAITADHGTYSEACVQEIIEPSSERSVSACGHADECGGCSWQQVAYEAQLRAKRENVLDALVRTAHFEQERAEKLVPACLPSKHEYNYRNKLELAASYSSDQGFLLGLKKRQSDQLIPLLTCPLAHKAIADAPKALRGALRYALGNQDVGLYRVGLRHSARTKSLEVALWTQPGAFPRARVAQTIQSALKTTSVVRVIADPGKQRKIKQVEVLGGKGYWEEELAGCTYKTSAPSFFQVNTGQADKMIEMLLAGLDLDHSATVADLYAGGGTFSMPLAQRFGTVYAVEAASSSVKDLRRNADENSVNITIIGGDSARELETLAPLDAVVVDPPRMGLAMGMAKTIAHVAPEKVAYISCDPQTWARDVVQLEKEGYRLISAQPIDMFPQTYHTEVVSIFEKRSTS